MASQDNFYLLLQIFDFDNDRVGSSDDDAAVKTTIHQALTARQRDWSKDSRNPRKASKAGHYLDVSKNAEQGLATMKQRRHAWGEARQIVEKDVRRTIGIFSSKGYLLSGEIDKIIEKVKNDDHVVINQARVMQLAPPGIKIRQEEVVQGKELEKPTSYSKYSSATSTLQVYGYDSLYDLLGRDRGITKVKGTPTSSWLQWAQDDKKKLPNKATTEVGDKRKLYELCAQEFASDAKRSRYDKYLAYEAVNAILNEVKDACSVSKKLETFTAETYIDRIYEAGAKAGMPITRDEAGQYLLGCCAQQAIRYVPPASSATGRSQPAKETCPWCGSLFAPGAEVCSNCGGKIKVACPNCGTSNRADVKFCSKCSYDYGNLSLASTLCDEARNYIKELRFDDASQLLQEAEDLWKGLDGIADARTLLTTQKTQLGPLVQQLETALQAKRLYEAKRQYTDIQRRSPGFSNTAVEEKIDSGMDAVKAQLHGRAIADVDLATLLSVYDQCTDVPGLSATFAGNPPQAVPAPTVHCDGKRRCNVISWQPSQTMQVTYSLIRKQGSPPLDSTDGEELTRTMGTNFTDEDVASAETYFYAVIVTFGPQQSGLAVSQGVENYFDVKVLNTLPAESSVQISWIGVPRNGKVIVRRSSTAVPRTPSDGEAVSNVVENGLLDHGLRNGVEYHYTIFVAYRNADGTTSYSSGVTCGAIPSAPPEPIEFIVAKLQPDGTFTLEWDQPSDGDTRFYYSLEEPRWHAEETVPQAQLDSALMPLTLASAGSGMGTFSLPDDRVYHILSATVKNQTALIGAAATVSSKKAVTIDKIDTSGANTVVMFSWPEESEKVLLAWRSDRFPASADERGATTKQVNRKSYDLNKAILVEGLDPEQTYYFSLFAQLGSGDAASFSAGSNMTFPLDKAVYWVETKGFFGKTTSVKLNIESTVDVPETELRVQKRTPPVFRTQGVRASIIPPQTGRGVHQVELDLSASILKEKKDMYYRLFVTDSSEDSRIYLSRRPGSHETIG